MNRIFRTNYNDMNKKNNNIEIPGPGYYDLNYNSKEKKIFEK